MMKAVISCSTLKSKYQLGYLFLDVQKRSHFGKSYDVVQETSFLRGRLMFFFFSFHKFAEVCQGFT